MKIMFLRWDTLTCFFFLGLTMSIFAQGSLTPPGAPAATMKSLDQIEARTPISSLPYTINTSGAYYFTKNLAASGTGAGITVSADNVTIDLNGFALTGGGSGSVTAITVPASQQSLCVRNGTISGWTNGAISAGNAITSLYEKLSLVNNNSRTSSSTSGALQTGTGSTVRDCAIYHTGTGNPSISPVYLIQGGAANTVVNCSIVTSGTTYSISVGTGSTVTGSSVTGGVTVAGGAGINVGDNCTVTQCALSGCEHGINMGQSGTVAHCTISGCGTAGIVAGNGAKISDCAADNNGGFGISLGGAGTVSHCTVNGNGFGITVSDGSAVTDCTITGSSTGTGVTLTYGSTVRGCTIRGSAGSGISGISGNYIEGNTCDANNTSVNSSAAGIYLTGSGNRIDSNSITANSFAGLQATSGGNIIIRNTFGGAEYIVANGNTLGPLVETASGSTISSTSPWANFHYN